MVGSEESPPGAGYPYDQWLTDLKASGNDPCSVGRSIVNRFVDNYPAENDITQSVIDLTKMDNLALKLDDFANSLRLHVADEKVAIANARDHAQLYKYTEYKDLWDYSDLIRASVTAPDIKASAIALQTALTGTGGAVMFSRHGSFLTTNSHGLSIYIDTPVNYRPSYSDLQLSRTGHWDEFLQEQRQ